MPTDLLPAADALWLGLDAPENRMTVTAVLRFADRLDRAAFAAAVQRAMVDAYPRFSQRVVRRPARRPLLVSDPGFAIDRHVVTTALPPDDAARDSGTGGSREVVERRLARLVADLLVRPLDLDRSPWQLHVVDLPDGTSCVVARLHHCLADGAALGQVLLGLADEAGPVVLPGAAVPDHGARVSVVQLVAGAARVLVDSSDPRTRGSVRLGVTKQVGWTRAVPLDRVRTAAHATGSTVNDVLLAAVSGALAARAARTGSAPGDVRVIVPVDLRRRGAPVPRELGNRFGFMLLRLPVSVDDPRSRVRLVHDRVERLRRSAQPAATYVALRAVGRLPRWTHRATLRLVGAGSSAIVTNVPGPREPLHIAGVPLRQVLFWVPQAGAIGLGISIFSHAGAVTVGVAADRAVVADPQALADEIERQIERLAAELPLESPT